MLVAASMVYMSVQLKVFKSFDPMGRYHPSVAMYIWPCARTSVALAESTRPVYLLYHEPVPPYQWYTAVAGASSVLIEYVREVGELLTDPDTFSIKIGFLDRYMEDLSGRQRRTHGENFSPYHVALPSWKPWLPSP